MNAPQKPGALMASMPASDVRVAPGPWHDVYLDPAGMTESDLEMAVLGLEDLGGRAVTHWDVKPDEGQVACVLAGCAAVIVRADEEIGASCVARLAREQGIPTLTVPQLLSGHLPVGRIAAPYAFMAVRIHDDFALVRHALATAVETELGMPCVYFEDTRVLAGTCGVRERTAALIRGASFFVADLSRSASSPGFDSPNTAHEIGMAQAFGVPLLVCAQAPRRDLYFSAGDLDTLFWRDEADLHERLRGWLRPRRRDLGRRVLANDVPRARLRAAQFAFDPGLRYRGPPSPLQRAWVRFAPMLGLGASEARWMR